MVHLVHFDIPSVFWFTCSTLLVSLSPGLYGLRTGLFVLLSTRFTVLVCLSPGSLGSLNWFVCPLVHLVNFTGLPVFWCTWSTSLVCFSPGPPGSLYWFLCLLVHLLHFTGLYVLSKSSKFPKGLKEIKVIKGFIGFTQLPGKDSHIDSTNTTHTK